MIALHEISKHYQGRLGTRHVLRGVNLTIEPGRKIGILGRNGAGKSTLIRILSGAERPSSGTIRKDMRVSWPLAFGGGFQGGLTGLDNIRFIARVYGVDIAPAMAYVKDFSELGRQLAEPVKTYSSGMRARLAFALSMAVEFDCYLIDEIVAVGDRSFHEKCHQELFVKRRDKAMIIVSHDPHYIREHCGSVGVLRHGKLVHFDSVNEGYHYYEDHA